MIENRTSDKFIKKKALSSSLRIIIPLYATYVLFVLSVFLVFIPNEKKHMMNLKKEIIRELTVTAWSLLSEYDQRVRQGELSIETAEQSAIRQIRNLRYGPEGKDYFWIVDMQHRVIMHPYMPELEGKDQVNSTDSNGKYIFAEFVNTVKMKGSGYVEYVWQWKDDSKKVGPKVSYVSGFLPWSWIIGTGIYLEDVRMEIDTTIQGFVKIFTGVLAIIILLSFYITWQAFKVDKKKILAEKAKHFEELRLKKLLELSQMSNASLRELTGFALEQAIKLTQSDIGYLAFLNDDETQLTMHTWSEETMKQCEIIDKKLVYQVDEIGMWGEAARRRKTVIINDYDNLKSPAKKGYPHGHVKISRMMSIPICDNEKIVALAGVGNKHENYNESDVRQLQLMMDGMWRIIQKKQSEDDLRKSEERYRLLADNATDGICIMQLSNLFLSYASPSMERILGYTCEEILELDIEYFMTQTSFEKVSAAIAEELEKEEKEGIDTNRYKIIELEQIRKNGSKVWTEVTASFLRDKNGKPDRVLGVTRDISKRKNLEHKFQQAQKMEAIGTLAGGIAHDFNNILSSVMGFTELVKLGCIKDEETKKNLDQVLAAGMRARDLVRHILTFSRRADVQKDLIQITPLIKECLKFLRASVPVNIEIRHHFDVTDGIVMADPTQIHQVLMNFFTNAAYAMKEKGGVLEVRLKSIEILNHEILQAKELKPGRYLQLAISDTGCGIPKELIERIFEPFFTTKGRIEGTGMGLSTAYGIIKDMGGAISTYSEIGMGTTFQLIIPEHPGESVTSTESADFFLMKGSGRILLVDDEESIVDWTRQVLLKLGYEVIGMSNSLETLEKFKQSPNDYDLVLTDMAMPRMTGLELSKQMISIRPDIPIILCTGFSEGLTSETIKDNGILDMIMKPMIASELARAVSKALKIEA
ncbi:cache domain-containing protein [Desulfobacula toluolica]|uniref:histidine kinase n=1 Tax=Desulfobacula toluolica (strain DSM 7467 / Tol2) TaxID=651182 RepID=K0NI39_DESTT|nr:cache domain-containing protein [Desulfobacula toluolica]CCK78637.1 predicted two component system sensor kinase, hybrid [Desulfobacula toluolica Tol2]